MLRVFADSAGDGLLKCCVRFHVDQEKAEVCLKLLSDDCNGAFVLWYVGFQVGEEEVVVLNDGAVDNLSNCARMRCVLMRWATGVSNAGLEGV